MSALKTLAISATVSAVIAAAGLFAASPAHAATAAVADAAAGPVTVVLVHGAWADGSSWNKVIPLLQSKGVSVLSVQNPLTSLADDVAAARRAIAYAKGSVVLVGHSWGGSVITEAGDDPKVKALVYVAAFANSEGQSGGDLIGAYPKQPVLDEVVPDGQGFLYLSEKGVAEDVGQDLPKAEAKVLTATQGALGAGAFGDRVTKAAWKTRPSWYVVSADDRALSPDLQRDLAKKLNAKTTVLRSSHYSILSHPQEIAAVIDEAVKAVQAQGR
jgi:pimeloyl-ACP methyl ester carboxylesterase